MEYYSVRNLNPIICRKPLPKRPIKETHVIKMPLAALAAVFALAFSSAAPAQDIQERTIKFGHLNNTDHPVSVGVRTFAQALAARSGGKLKVQEFPASQLGNELQQQAALQGGVQEMTAPATTSLAGIVKEFGLIDFPFAVSTFAQADALLDGPFGQALIAKLPEKGLVEIGRAHV